MKTAVVLFNLGGPDSLEAVEPFLFNLFCDPAIIRLPKPLRWLVAKLISGRRAPIARGIYAKMGGRSPIVENTEAQARALERRLGPDFKTFIAMRYWSPRAAEQVAAVAAWRPERIVLIPLYPQYSSTTTGSSVREWQAAAAKIGLSVPTTTLCCFPTEPGFIEAAAERVRVGLRALPRNHPARVLFSAHGLPKKIIEAGDPYQWQVERTVAAIRDELDMPGLDSVVCYQSRVGPMKWIGPSTEAEVRRAAKEGVSLLLVPVAFVSEHSETLVELDIEYRELAHREGPVAYMRAPTVDAAPSFIDGLTAEIRRTASTEAVAVTGPDGRICPAKFGACPCGDMRGEPAGMTE